MKNSFEDKKKRVRNDQTGYEMTKVGMKWTKFIENKSGYKMTKTVRNDVGTK